jgi:cbb3-type cytochrome oxidase maturation protein
VETLFLLIPLSLIALGIAVMFFFRMNATGQFDDDQGPAWSVVLDDDRASESDGASESESIEPDSIGDEPEYNPSQKT